MERLPFVEGISWVFKNEFKLPVRPNLEKWALINGICWDPEVAEEGTCISTRTGVIAKGGYVFVRLFGLLMKKCRILGKCEDVSGLR